MSSAPSTAEPKDERGWGLLFAAWVIAALGTLGSLYFSEIMDFAPCSLCWYQRIFLYPLVLVLLAGLFPLDRAVVRYAMPLTIGGALVAAYHVLLYHGIIPESAAPCRQGVSCKTEYIELFGFLSIPAMSMLAFAAIAGLLLPLRKRPVP